MKKFVILAFVCMALTGCGGKSVNMQKMHINGIEGSRICLQKGYTSTRYICAKYDGKGYCSTDDVYFECLDTNRVVQYGGFLPPIQ